MYGSTHTCTYTQTHMYTRVYKLYIFRDVPCLQVYRAKKRAENEGIVRGYQRKLLKAIDDIRKTKQEQRKMVDSQVTVLEVY